MERLCEPQDGDCPEVGTNRQTYQLVRSERDLLAGVLMTRNIPYPCKVQWREMVLTHYGEDDISEVAAEAQEL